MKMTTENGRWPQNMKSRISQQPLVRSYSNMKLKLTGLNLKVKRCHMKMKSKKTTLNGRWPQNMKSRISQQQLVRSYSNLKLKLIGLNQRIQRCQMKMTSNGRQPKMEDDLKIWKVEYLSNHWSDLTRSRN